MHVQELRPTQELEPQAACSGLVDCHCRELSPQIGQQKSEPEAPAFHSARLGSGLRWHLAKGLEPGRTGLSTPVQQTAATQYTPITRTPPFSGNQFIPQIRLCRYLSLGGSSRVGTPNRKHAAEPKRSRHVQFPQIRTMARMTMTKAAHEILTPRHRSASQNAYGPGRNS